MKVDLKRDTWEKVGDLNYGDLFLSNGEAWLITMEEPSHSNNRACVKLENGMVLEFLKETEVEYVPDAKVVYERRGCTGMGGKRI